MCGRTSAVRTLALSRGSVTYAVPAGPTGTAGDQVSPRSVDRCATISAAAVSLIWLVTCTSVPFGSTTISLPIASSFRPGL
jgi:hypothetical protein